MAKKTFLDFETPIAELENKIEELRYVQTESAVDISAEINQLAKKSQQLTKDIYSDLTPWQITKIDKLRREFIWQPLVWQGLATVCRKDIQDHFAT